jgi:hypothetical protein
MSASNSTQATQQTGHSKAPALMLSSFFGKLTVVVNDLAAYLYFGFMNFL